MNTIEPVLRSARALTVVLAVAVSATAAVAQQRQMAIWTFPTVNADSGDPILATAEIVDGAPTVTLNYHHVDDNGKDGFAYTDLNGTAHPASRAAAWEDLHNPTNFPNDPDAEFVLKINTAGWVDLSIRFDFKSQMAVSYDLEYSTNNGASWSKPNTTDNGVDYGNRCLAGEDPQGPGGCLAADNDWHTILNPLEGTDILEDGGPQAAPVWIRITDLDRNGGNDKFRFDNLEVRGTSLLDLPTIAADPSQVSGVVSDPTDPGTQEGFRVTVSDAEAEASTLTVTASSANQACVPDANLTVVLDPTCAESSLACTTNQGCDGTCTDDLCDNDPAVACDDDDDCDFGACGTDRFVKVEPVGVCYDNVITLTVDDADQNSVSTELHYSASAAALDPSLSVFHTGASDVSTGVAIDANHVFTGNDEDQELRLYDRNSSGGPVYSFDPTASLGLTDIDEGTPREVDIEASLTDGSRIYWIGSHGNSNEKPGSPGGECRPNRRRIFATDVSGTGEDATLSYVGRYDGLLQDLIDWDNDDDHGKGTGYYGFAASAHCADSDGIPPKRVDGFNIEALAWAPGSPGSGDTAYIGFRAPLIPTTDRKRALVVPITNLSTLVSANPSAGPATFGPPIEMDLEGLGIRSMLRDDQGQYLILAGPFDNANAFQLFTWSGDPLEQPLLRITTPDLITLNGGPSGGIHDGSYETVLIRTPGDFENPGAVFDLLLDNGRTDWYGINEQSKDLPTGFQKFRRDMVTLGDRFNIVGLVPLPDCDGAGTLGWRVRLTGTNAAAQYEYYYSDSLSMTTPWVVKEKNIAGVNGTMELEDCGGPGTPPTGFYTAALMTDPDEDGLSSGYEIRVTFTHPLKKDSNDNMIDDGCENFDNDELLNVDEYELGSSAVYCPGARSAKVAVSGQEPPVVEGCRQGFPDPFSGDSDGDTIGDATDTFPLDPSAWFDNDCDGNPDQPLSGASDSIPPLVEDERFTLTTSVSGPGAGTLSGAAVPGTAVDADTIDCPTTCAADFYDNTEIQLTPLAAPGSIFVGWTGGGCAGDGPCTVTLTSSANVDAAFGIAPALIAVNTTDDELNADGDCSLREAVSAANLNVAVDGCVAGTVADVIVFDPSVVPGTFVLSLAGADEDAGLTGDLDITESVTIQGAGASQTILDGGNLDRVIDLAGSNMDVELVGLTIRNGSAGFGGGIAGSGNSRLTVRDCVVADNFATNSGGGISAADGLTLVDSTISGNSANVAGGGVRNFDAANTTIAGSSFHGNSANLGGGLHNSVTVATITNSTFYDNYASDVGGAIWTNDVTTIASATIALNESDFGSPGVFNDGPSVLIENSIVAGNFGFFPGTDDCVDNGTSLGHNVFGSDVSACVALDPTDVHDVDAGLDAFAMDGTPGSGHFPLTLTSPAVDFGNDATCPATDQLGTARPQDGDADGGAVCDAGAVEFVALSAFVLASHAEPAVGSQLAACLFVDSSPSSTAVGGYGASLTWDPAVLSFVDTAGGDPPFDTPIVNDKNAAAGVVSFADADAVGATGIVHLACVELMVVGEDGAGSALDLELTSLSAAGTAADLLPNTVVQDAAVEAVLACDIGDPTGDDNINTADAVVILSDEIGLPVPAVVERGLNARCGDTNLDGVANSIDANIVLSSEVGLPVDPAFPVGDSNVTVDFCSSCGDACAECKSIDAPKSAGNAPIVATVRPIRKTGGVAHEREAQVVVELPAGQALASYGARLAWDPQRWAFVEAVGGSGPAFTRPLFNLREVERGVLTFAEVHAEAAEGAVELLRIRFRARSREVAKPDLRLEFTSMGAAGPRFQNLLPRLEVSRGGSDATR